MPSVSYGQTQSHCKRGLEGILPGGHQYNLLSTFHVGCKMQGWSREGILTTGNFCQTSRELEHCWGYQDIWPGYCSRVRVAGAYHQPNVLSMPCSQSLSAPADLGRLYLHSTFNTSSVLCLRMAAHAAVFGLRPLILLQATVPLSLPVSSSPFLQKGIVSI